LVNCAACQDGREFAEIPIEGISDPVARPACLV